MNRRVSLKEIDLGFSVLILFAVESGSDVLGYSWSWETLNFECWPRLFRTYFVIQLSCTTFKRNSRQTREERIIAHRVSVLTLSICNWIFSFSAILILFGTFHILEGLKDEAWVQSVVFIQILKFSKSFHGELTKLFFMHILKLPENPTARKILCCYLKRNFYKKISQISSRFFIGSAPLLCRCNQKLILPSIVSFRA